MIKRIRLSALISLLMLIIHSTANTAQPSDDLLVLKDLVNLITEDTEESHPSVSGEASAVEPVPEVLSDIVANYYAEEVVSDNFATGVLTFLTSAYSEHGYNDYGVWAPKREPNSQNRIIYPGSKFSSYEVSSGFSYPAFFAKDCRRPVEGGYTSFFGYRPNFGRHHNGIDIALNIGDTVKCVLPGVVVKVNCDPVGYGNYVVVRHDGELETLYAHLAKELVEAGQEINTGDPIGLGGVTGNATGPHLHFETRLKGEAINPLNYLPPADVRK